MKQIMLIAFWAAGAESPEAMKLARRAYEQVQAGQFSTAIADLREAARLAPANPLYRSALGGVYERQGQLGDAVGAFTEALRLDPRNEKFRIKLEALSLDWGAVLAREQRYRAGLAFAKETAVRFPNSSAVQIMLGLFLTRNQQNLAAVEAYRRALTLDTQSAEANIGLGIAQSNAGLTREAQATFEAGIRLFPKDPMHRQAYGVLLVKMLDPRAAGMLESALAIDGKLAEAHYQLGNLALARGETAAALMHFEAAFTNGLDESRYRFAHARALRHAGEAPTPEVSSKAKPAAPAPPGLPPLFRDVTAAAGITWRHFNGQSPDRFLVESTAGGVGFLDFDNDGRLDLLLVNGGETPRGRARTPVRHALYRNLGGGKFVDVAAKVGIAQTNFFGMGVAAADYDNDGFSDVYLSGYPAGALFHNNGNGTFTDVTARAGVANQDEWGASAAWFDFDNDGRLDLFIANYAEFSFKDARRCEFEGKPVYCAQTAYPGRRSRLYRNKGDGTFAEVPIPAPAGRALGVVAIDYDGDGWQDLFVARDASPNLLLRNRGDGTFEDKALDAEVALNIDGVARAGMGVDAGDVDGDGSPDFAVTNFDHEYHALYLNPGRLPFRDATAISRLAEHTRPFVGWGLRFLDYDNDGDQDLLIVNGHLHEMISRSNSTVSYREPPLLLSNDGHARFSRVDGGPVFAGAYLARGLATGDFDNDGAVDAAFISLNDLPVLLHNEAAMGRRWLGVRLRGTASNRDAIGAKLTLDAGGRRLTRWITGGGSFLASHDRRVVFGLGGNEPGALEIRWPSGRVQRVDGLIPGQYHDITEPHD
jgi:tetratricopeptide (TPR) repeat protein